MKKVGFENILGNFDDAYTLEGVGCIPQDYRGLGAGIWCIDSWYYFGGRFTSAGKSGRENFFTSILMVKNAIFFAF